MVAWDIQSDEAWTVTFDASVEADYEQDQKSFDSAFQDVLDAVAHGGEIADALDLFLALQVQEQLLGVVNRSDSAVRGARGAINAYIRGDMEMAATAQRNSDYAPEPRDLPGAPRVISGKR